MTIPPHIILSIVLFGPGIIACYIFLKKIQQNRSRSKDPIDSEVRLRLPGHSLLEKIEKVHEEVADKITFLVFPTVIHAWVFYIFFENSSADEWTFIFLFGVESGIIALLGFNLWRLLKELQSYRLGYRGEVFVSQILQPLTLMGYRVFHDIEFENFNIDHVLVCDSGVYCLETNTHRKPKASEKADECEVEYDGKQLHYPWGTDTWSLQNVQRNASTLAKLLREKTGESIPVYPILLLPGWKVNRTAKGSINVINPKELPAGLFYFPEYPISEPLIEEIESVLSDKSNEHFSGKPVPRFQH